MQSFLTAIDKLSLPLEKELVLVDDCSTDNSRQIIETFDFQSPHIFLQKNQNEGKGAAIRDGIQKATGDIIGIQDADFEYEMNDIAFILTFFISRNADVVYGSRYKKSNHQVFRTYHYFVNRFLTILSNLLSGIYFSDMETCYKFFKAEIIKNFDLKTNRFGFEPEVTAKLARLKTSIYEVSISYYPRTYHEGKKITWKDGVAAIWHIIYFNLLENRHQCFKKSMPDKYILERKQLL